MSIESPLNLDPVLLGDRLAQARRDRGVTQQEAANVIDVARTTITAIEKGTRKPRASELARLLLLYGRSVSEFMQPATSVNSASFLAQFRESNPKGESDSHRTEAIQQFERLARWYRELELEAGITELAALPPTYALQSLNAEQAGELLASSERNRLGLGDGPIADLWRLLESDAGMRIFSFPFNEMSVASMFIYSSELGACVALNANHPPQRQRWSLAHEYAHLLTDPYKAEILVLDSHRRVSTRERIADAFASHFLMPTNGLIRRFQALQNETGGRITPTELLQLSQLYAVSAESMTRRLEDLHLIPADTWDRLHVAGLNPESAQQMLVATSVKTCDPRFPLRYVALNVAAYQAGELSEGQLATRLMSDRLETRRLVAEASGTPALLGGDFLHLPIDLGFEIVARAR